MRHGALLGCIGVYWGSSFGLLRVPVKHQWSWGGLVEPDLELDSGPPGPLGMRDAQQQEKGNRKTERIEKKKETNERKKGKEKRRRGFPLEVRVKVRGPPVKVQVKARGESR